MQKETASTSFLKYGSVYRKLGIEKEESLICQIRRVTAQSTLSQFLRFSCDTYIEVQSGTGFLLVSFDLNENSIEEFGLNHRVHIKPNVYFAFVSTTPELVVELYSERDFLLDVANLRTPYVFRPVLPRIQIDKILGYYYRIRTPGYRFGGEEHSFFELTYVDVGTLYTEVDGKSYTIGEKEMMIYGPGQHHSQHTDDSQSASYVTILFQMGNTFPDVPEDWYKVLLNQVVPYNKKTYTLVRTLVQESESGAPYTNSLMLCLLTEIIIRLLQGIYTQPTAQPSSVLRQNYQSDLFEQVVAYVESKIYEPLTVSEICQHFSLSRSSLQLLFKTSVNQSPKRFISDMKLERSCQMLRENKYTVSEVSLKLGYSSIHYFSNAFSQKYHISPSEYAKRIY